MITGTRAAISEEDTEAYRDSGLAHVMSISGLHLGIAGLGIFFVVRALLALSPRLALTHPIKKWAAVAAFLSASFYLLISGGGSPAVRSHLMLSAMLLGVIADRPALSMRAVAIAALLLLVFVPDEIVSPGFQMSFAAVIGLIALAEWASSRPRREEPQIRLLRWLGRSRRYVLGMLATSLVATLATTPFAIYHFDRAASYSLLANLLAEPIVAFVIMPSGTVARGNHDGCHARTMGHGPPRSRIPGPSYSSNTLEPPAPPIRADGDVEAHDDNPRDDDLKPQRRVLWKDDRNHPTIAPPSDPR